MMTPAQAKQCLLTTDYPMDKVIGMRSGSQSVPFNTSLATEILHGFDYRPLAMTTYSTDSDFSISKDEGAMLYGSPDKQLGVMSYTDETKMTLAWFNNTGSAKTVYWRTYFLPPSDADDAAANWTSADTGNFIVNSDYNYSKLYMAGKTPANSTVYHNLGYKPQIVVWQNIGYGVTRMTSPSSNLSFAPYGSSVRVFDDRIIVSADGECHYRIYLDE